MMTHLIFSIGPVQGFIEQSRRTADGWVGSFLLSYLSCKAAIALEEKGLKGERLIVEPHLENIPLYKKLKKPESSDPGDLTIAGLPNNIVVKLNDDEGTNDKAAMAVGKATERIVKDAWEEIAQSIFKAVFPRLFEAEASLSASEKFLKSIWARQATNHWEYYWAWGENAKAAFQNLSARKGLRDFSALEEVGERCTLCGEREALWDGKTGNEKTSRRAVLRFWQKLLKDKKEIGKLSGIPTGLIRSKEVEKKSGGKETLVTERLCAICLIKRLIPWETKNPVNKLWTKEEKNPNKEDPCDKKDLCDSVFPSTSTMATVLYKVELVEKAYGEDQPEPKTAIENYLNKIPTVKADPADAFLAWREILDKLEEKDPPPPLDQLHKDEKKKVRQFLSLDGDWLLYGESTKNERGISDADATQIEQAYRQLIKAAKNAGLKDPPIYWALLTMDGDRMGKLKEEKKNQEESKGELISQTINTFAIAVRAIVVRHNGRLVYAGGDDVLALLPVDTALDAAEELRKEFYKIFETSVKKNDLTVPKEGCPTLSGSIVYAHHQAPLGRLIERGHTLLKEWAKGKAGRNALAVEVFKRGGPSLTFARKWEKEDKEKDDLVAGINGLKTLLEGKETSTGFLYGLRREEELLGEDGPFGSDTDQKIDYIASLARKTRLGEEKNKTEEEKDEAAQEVARKILALSIDPVSGAFSADPLIFTRFLAGGGREVR